MELNTIKKAVAKSGRMLAFIFFGLFLAWPLLHVVIINVTKISSWRLFGWGMYATPTPGAEGVSRLRVVIPEKDEDSNFTKAQWHTLLTKINADSFKENICVNLFLAEPQGLRRLSHQGLCQNHFIAKDLAYFLNFNSLKHLANFINAALLRANQTGTEAYAFLTHQRFNLFTQTAYLESDVYKVSKNRAQYLETIKHEGGNT